MHNPANLPKTEGGGRLRRVSLPGTERALGAGLSSRDMISSFLNNAVLNHLNRENADRCNFQGGDGPTDTFSEGDEQAAGLHLLPPPGPNRKSSEIPTWKRILDILIISLTWPVWLPIMLLIAATIKITSVGPIFYRQERVGYRGRRFMIFKFRTMKVNVDTQVHESHFERLIATDSPMTKLDAHGDPRLIKWGRFYRAAGLDELPQIFNVLRGEMSLVGARPCTVHEFERYQPWQRERVQGPPGLTGYWQVNGKNKTTFSEMIEMDIFYGKNMSLRLDLSIILKTIPAIVQQVLESRGIDLRWKRAEKLVTARQ